MPDVSHAQVAVLQRTRRARFGSLIFSLQLPLMILARQIHQSNRSGPAAPRGVRENFLLNPMHP